VTLTSATIGTVGLTRRFCQLSGPKANRGAAFHRSKRLLSSALRGDGERLQRAGLARRCWTTDRAPRDSLRAARWASVRNRYEVARSARASSARVRSGASGVSCAIRAAEDAVSSAVSRRPGAPCSWSGSFATSACASRRPTRDSAPTALGAAYRRPTPRSGAYCIQTVTRDMRSNG
jgi:hypothetical protein